MAETARAVEGTAQKDNSTLLVNGIFHVCARLIPLFLSYRPSEMPPLSPKAIIVAMGIAKEVGFFQLKAAFFVYEFGTNDDFFYSGEK